MSDLSQTHAACERMFRLLVPASTHVASVTSSIEVAGMRWVPTEYEPVPSPDEAPEYTCISYSWGEGRTAHPFDDRHSMSDKALPALEATIHALRPPAIWLDALCVPSEGPERSACLRSMGKIYGSASQVAAVLSQSCLVVLEQIHATGRIEPESLLVLENDDWVTRAWTYQELANSRKTLFIAQGGSPVSVDSERFFDEFGFALSAYKKTHGLDALKMRALHPRLDSLEEALADWMIGAPLERSAYQIMSAMDARFSEQKEDYFNAAIGAITAAPLDGPQDPALHPAEHFMRVCEAKRDFSFIYCVAPRSQVPGRCWRPLAGSMAAILPWHSWGSQPGSLHPTYLHIDNMCRMTRNALGVPAREFIEEWLQRSNAAPSSNNLADCVFENLKQAGFTGRGDYLELEGGYFFPHSPPTQRDSLVIIAAGVRWVHGAPGLLVSLDSGDIHLFGGVGVFVGPVPQSGDTLKIA